MGQKISILPENLCNQIAAGEVVERPASVVKELLENSLDAGATEIRIEVEKGGKRLIRVIDDGEGMSRDDALLCLERHATSKIRRSEDLFQLHTLGFRGEALPSIAAVSRFSLRTRSAESLEGWEFYAEAGTMRKAGAAGCPTGTTIEVRDLFFNTPARRKFLRRDETELGHVADVVTKLALACPEVQFHLSHNGRTLVDVYRQGSLPERVGSLLGRPVLQEMVKVSADGPDGLGLNGLISQPSAHRASGSAIYTFINGRYIRDRVVHHALLEGYRSVLEKGRYPLAVLFLTIAPELVDVNVHPTKHEVRFRDQRTVHGFISASVREALRPSDWLGADVQAPSETGAGASALPEAPAAPNPPPSQAPAAAEHRQRIQESLQQYAARSPAASAVFDPSKAGVRPPATPFTLPERRRGESEETGFFSSLQILGQYRGSYILCQDGDDLLLVDQHAAHERIGFERLRRQFRHGRIERQNLLFPAVIELDFREAALLEEVRAELDRLGFELEPFGGKAFALKAVPALLAEADVERLVRDVAAEIGAVGKTGLIEEKLEDVLMLMACHGVVRANQALDPAQIKALLRDLDEVDFKTHCPHGRPVSKRITLGEVERMFMRA